ncbi:MAG TPA: WecB/TagA/CpsF family glycosyltransferase [Chloroflexota bacterium]|nr:WecB/TagA/CpsF family glycosyltransferase [Chloroflexota bacterium]
MTARAASQRSHSEAQGRRATRFHVLGVGVDRVTIEQAAEQVIRYARGGATRHVVTVNPEFVVTARRHAAFRRVLCHADLATADGMGIIWAARILGDRLPERVGGVELLERIAAKAAASGSSLFLLGAAEGVAAEAADALRARYPRLLVAGTYAGSPRAAEADGIIERIRDARPAILFVAFGAPAQDLWIATYRARLDVPVAMGVGGAFDYLAGRAARAPRLIQRTGFEWLYRLIRQPWRWRRMLALPRFGGMVIATRILGLLCRRP